MTSKTEVINVSAMSPSRLLGLLGAGLVLAGAALLVVAAANADYPACGPGITGVAGMRADGSTFGGCGVDPVPFLVAGSLAIAGGITALVIGLRRRPS